MARFRRLVEHARERVRRVEADRREHRQQLAHEVVADPGALRPGPVLAPREHHALLRQRRQQHAVQQPVLLADQRARLRRHQLVDLRRAAAVRDRTP